MTRYNQVKQDLKKEPKKWLVTGVAGFIGSNLLEELLTMNQQVRGLDNFSTGYEKNLEHVRAAVTSRQWKNFSLVKGDIRDARTCADICGDRDYVLHQAALGSVPRSIKDPVTTNDNNIGGFLNMLVASKDAGVEKFVYAASSSTYGDHKDLPKIENRIGKPLSPYAVTKYVNELYADVFANCYGLKSIGLRYFNIFGKRQDPDGAYAAVIPLWFKSLIRGEETYINGDGETSRDFCFIENCVQANILAAASEDEESSNEVYNVAFGQRTTLNELFSHIRERVLERYPHAAQIKPVHRDFRQGDVRHSLADISKARTLLGYEPQYSIIDGLDKAASWYLDNMR